MKVILHTRLNNARATLAGVCLSIITCLALSACGSDTGSSSPSADTVSSARSTDTITTESSLNTEPEATSPPAPSPPPSPSTTDGEVLYDPESLGQLGDCFNEGTYELVAVPCADPHDYQIVLADGVFQSPDGADYPGEDAWVEWEQTNCIPALELFTGQPYRSSDIDFATYPPTYEGWEEGDRGVWCVAYRGEEQWTGSLEAG